MKIVFTVVTENAPVVSASSAATAATATDHTSPQICGSIKRDGNLCQRTCKPGENNCVFHMSTCEAITSKGLKCNNGCMEGTNRCGYHAATCPGLTKTGDPCQMAQEFCRHHRNVVTTTATAATASATTTTTALHSVVPKHVCLGLTQKNKPCRIMIREDQEYCHFHGGDQ